jgi:hypothetical protein
VLLFLLAYAVRGPNHIHIEHDANTE